MGCDIHLITEVKKNGRWQYVEKRPESFCCRNYSIFAMLAGVRNYSGVEGFEPKGLPDDLSGRKFLFQSETGYIRRGWEEGTELVYKLPDGSICSSLDGRLFKTVNSLEEARKYKTWHINEPGSYSVFCPDEKGAEVTSIPTKERYASFEEYLAQNYQDEWDETAQDYGYWEVDFDCCDYHTPSWLTLKELLDYCNDGEFLAKTEVPRQFYDNFIKLGGILPDGMKAKEDSDDYESIVIMYKSEERPESYGLKEGLEELKKIAKDHSVEPKDIRIVFAFDN